MLTLFITYMFPLTSSLFHRGLELQSAELHNCGQSVSSGFRSFLSAEVKIYQPLADRKDPQLQTARLKTIMKFLNGNFRLKHALPLPLLIKSNYLIFYFLFDLFESECVGGTGQKCRYKVWEPVAASGSYLILLPS